ncbi:MAG: hypothetical protein ACOYPS_07805, partial [Phycisphaerales bacterium]
NVDCVFPPAIDEEERDKTSSTAARPNRARATMNVDCVFPPAIDEEERDKTPTTCHAVCAVPTECVDFPENSHDDGRDAWAGRAGRAACSVLEAWEGLFGVGQDRGGRCRGIA